MLYATMDKDRWSNLPPEWDEVQDMFKYLNRMTWGHQITFESRLFSAPDAPKYRCTLILWESVPPKGNLAGYDRKREVLLETSDPEQMEAALFMLISEAEAEHKAAKHKGSMVP